MVRDFDISSILAFNPPRYVCPACRGLFNEVDSRKELSQYAYSCPVCKVDYTFPSWYGNDRPYIYKMLDTGGYRISEADMFAHARSLATLLAESKLQLSGSPWPTMRLLLEVLGRAKIFVHFTSWGISHVLIGALKATSTHVPIYGFVSNVESSARAQLTQAPEEAPRLKVKVIPSSEGIYDAPHQKIVVVDGLVAFKGSTNLTNAGMRRADRSLDISEIETNVGKVVDLNNRYFAPVWKQRNAPGGSYEMDWPPF